MVGAANEDPVDNGSAVAASTRSGFTRSEQPGSEPVKSLAATWFEPLWEIRQGEAVLHGWRFICPFCGQKRESNDYRETYGRAYRHLETCEWTSRDGLLSGDVDAF